MYEPLDKGTPGLTLARVLLTICVFEFFGPCIRDFSPSHLFNPDWVGHARLHLMWLLGLFLFSGVANLYLIWFVRPLRLIHLYTASAWLAANFFGFWIAVLLTPFYGGLVVVPEHHMHIWGIEENIFVFLILSAFYLGAIGVLHFRVRPAALHKAG